MHMDMTALGSLATIGAETPQGLGQQLEYLFAQQFLAALTRTAATEDNKQSEGSEYLSLLSEPLARQMAEQGALGIGRQLGEEVDS